MFGYRRYCKTKLQTPLSLLVGAIACLLSSSPVVSQEFQPTYSIDEPEYIKQSTTECPNEVVESFIQRLQTLQSSLVETAAVVNQLVNCGSDAVPALFEILQSERDAVITRRIAARTLGQIGTAEAIAALLEVAQSQSEIRDSAIRALEDAPPETLFLMAINASEQAAIRPQNALSSVIEALGHGDAEIRAAAAESLGDMGSTAHVAIPSLIKLVEDDIFVRAEAVHALAQIGTEGIDALLTAMQNGEVNFVFGAIALLQIEEEPTVREAVERATPSLLEVFHSNNLTADDGCALFLLLDYAGQIEAGAEVLAVQEARGDGCVGNSQAGGLELLSVEAGTARGIASQPAICRFRVMQRVLWRCRT